MSLGISVGHTLSLSSTSLQARALAAADGVVGIAVEGVVHTHTV